MIVHVILFARTVIYVNGGDQSNVDQSQRKYHKYKEEVPTLQDHYSLDSVENDTSLDDKRVVPTGSNPLHNR